MSAAGPALGFLERLARPQVGAVRILFLDRRRPYRLGHLVDLGIAQRRDVIEQAGEVVRQAARVAAGERASDHGRVELRVLQGDPVCGVGAGFVGEQQRGADLGRHRSPAQHRSDVVDGAQPTRRDERHVVAYCRSDRAVDAATRRRAPCPARTCRGARRRRALGPPGCPRRRRRPPRPRRPTSR